MTAETSRKSKKQTAHESALEKQQRRTLVRNTAIAIVGIVLLGGAIFYVANETLQGRQDLARPAANPNEQVIAEEGSSHVDEGTPLTYEHYPPSSGNHYDTPLGPGFYEVAYLEGYWLHSLEHGSIVIAYKDADDADLKAQIRDLINEAPKRRCGIVRIVAVPYTLSPTPITLLAWGKELNLETFDKEVILNFYKRYEDRGPETIPC